MAIRGIYNADGTTTYTVADQRNIHSKSFGNKVIYGDSALVVSAQSTPNMTVKVSSGECSINGAILQNTASTNLAITSNTASYARIDAIVAYINGTTYDLRVLKGTAAVTPSAPNCSSNMYVKLAEVYVGVGVSLIQNSNIKDCRNTAGQNITDGLSNEIVNIKTRINSVSNTIFYKKPTDTWTIEITPIQGENFSKIHICGADILKQSGNFADLQKNLPFNITFTDRIFSSTSLIPPEGNNWQGMTSGYGSCMCLINNGSKLRIVLHGLTANITYTLHWGFDGYTLNSELPADVQAKIKAMNV